MLGKQWLNRYNSTDMRGTAIERSHNRQRKLDGVVAWYFNVVMESLTLMLQIALLLFGCAISRYLWEVDVTIASVVIGVTSFGVLSYLFLIIAGAASESCPYQTPGAHTLRHYLLPALRSTRPKFYGFIKASYCCKVPTQWWKGLKRPWCSISNVANSLSSLLSLHIALLVDVYRLARAILRSPVDFSRTVYHRFTPTHTPRKRDLGQETIVLDLRCVSWVLLTSLNKAFHLTTLKYLAAMPELACFDPSLIIGCFNVLVVCINVVDGVPVIVQGLEQLAMVAATCFLRTFRHFFETDPTSGILEDLRRRYNRAFSLDWLDFRDYPFRYTMIATHLLVNQHRKPPVGWRWWDDNRPSAQDHIQLAWSIAEAAQAGYQRMRREKVPRWTLRFAFDSLSLDPLPPPSVVADCLKIIAIDLGCDVSDIRTLDDRYV